ncbi:ribonuclease III [bacterium]|nr:ribonuclease III [bacterium]
MRFLVPAKKTKEVARGGKRSQGSQKEREIWDDFLDGKKQKKKVAFEKDAEGRFTEKREKGQEKTLGAVLDHLKETAVGLEHEVVSTRKDFEVLEERLGYKFTNRSLLERALTHRSALGPQDRLDYERLEFLGDAVLDLGVAHYLINIHPEAREGDLSKMRAALVNTSALANFAKELEIGPFIRLGRSEFASGGAERPSILADVMEAVFGALYLDSSFDRALEVIQGVFGDNLASVVPSDPKTELQEALYAAGSEAPQYLVEMVEGPEHAPTFVTICVVDHEIVGRGRGNTKKAAQQEAASEVLRKLTPKHPLLNLVEGQNAIFAPALLVTVLPAQAQ